jgi:diguanylate cyclase (GGDEF)-like protein
MITSAQSHFEGYNELILKPLERHDERSFLMIQKLLNNGADFHTSLFGFLIEALSGITIAEREARNHWKKILEHKRRLELNVCRLVSIKTAVIDYYDQLGISPDTAAMEKTPPAASTPHYRNDGGSQHSFSAEERLLYQFMKSPDEKLSGKTADAVDTLFERLATPGYHQERFKEEMMRARRYKHALSAIMFDLNLQAISESSVSPETRDKTLSIIVKMINKTVRIVDILTRYSENHFLLILPNTNKREARELAERLKNNICERTIKIPGLSGGIPITLAVGQCSKDDTSVDFNKCLENLVESGKKKAPNTVYALE